MLIDLLEIGAILHEMDTQVLLGAMAEIVRNVVWLIPLKETNTAILDGISTEKVVLLGWLKPSDVDLYLVPAIFKNINVNRYFTHFDLHRFHCEL